MVQGAQPTYPYEAVDFSGGVVGSQYSLPFSPQSVDITKQPDLVLGENGVAFAKGSTTVPINGVQTTVDQIASFNITSGASNWTYQATSGTTLSLIEATAGNGLAARTTGQTGTDTVLIFNPGGTPSGMNRARTMLLGANSAAPPDFSGLSQTDYYSNGLWVGASGGGTASEVALLIQSAMSSYSHEKGNHPKQSTAAPIIQNFETVDPVHNPNQNQTAAAFPSRYNGTNNYPPHNGNGVSIGTLTQAHFFVNSDASESNFIGQIFKPIDAVAFIGHSLGTSPTNPIAIGICFGQSGLDEGLPLYPCDSTGQGGYTFGPYNGGYYQIAAVAPSIASQAKILFFAACDLNTTMQNFFGITNSTAGRALLFPQSTTDIDLDMGEYEWRQIVAVAKANTATKNAGPWYQYNPDTGTNVQVPTQAWQVIGDSGNGGAGIHF